MSLIIVGGHECMHCRYRNMCQKRGHSVKVYTQMTPQLGKHIGNADGIILLAGYLIIKNTIGFNFIPNISQNMGYGILFVIGLVTSLHCVAMCGGINLSQAVSYKFSEAEKKDRFARL